MKSNPKTLTCNWRKKDREEEKKRRRGEREDETYKAAKSFEQSPSGDWRSPIAAAMLTAPPLGRLPFMTYAHFSDFFYPLPHCHSHTHATYMYHFHYPLPPSSVDVINRSPLKAL